MDVAASEFFTEDKCYDLNFKEKNNDGSGKKTGWVLLGGVVVYAATFRREALSFHGRFAKRVEAPSPMQLQHAHAHAAPLDPPQPTRPAPPELRPPPSPRPPPQNLPPLNLPPPVPRCLSCTRALSTTTAWSPSRTPTSRTTGTTGRWGATGGHGVGGVAPRPSGLARVAGRRACFSRVPLSTLGGCWRGPRG